MSKKERLSLPPTGGGLFRSYDDEGIGFRLKPEHIIIATVAVIVFEIFLHLYGRALF